MTKKEFLARYVLPIAKKNDKPFNRQIFNDTKDMLHKNGAITDTQVENWIYPNTKLFE